MRVDETVIQRADWSDGSLEIKAELEYNVAERSGYLCINTQQRYANGPAKMLGFTLEVDWDTDSINVARVPLSTLEPGYRHNPAGATEMYLGLAASLQGLFESSGFNNFVIADGFSGTQEPGWCDQSREDKVRQCFTELARLIKQTVDDVSAALKLHEEKMAKVDAMAAKLRVLMGIEEPADAKPDVVVAAPKQSETWADGWTKKLQEPEAPIYQSPSTPYYSEDKPDRSAQVFEILSKSQVHDLNCAGFKIVEACPQG